MLERVNRPHLEEFFSFGNDLINETRLLVSSLWQKKAVRFELKADKTPVSEVDLRCEELVREKILARFPSHGVAGEELGTHKPDAEFVWTIDPIDGTQNLINRIPTFGTILALQHHGKPLLGWIDHPILGETLRGGPETGTFHNDKPVRITDLESPVLSPNDVIGINNPSTFEHGGHLPVLWKVLKFHPHIRMYYDVYSHSLAILGSLAAHVEYNLKVWDYAASQALVEGAGGVYKELGRDSEPGKPELYHAVFGKRRAVETIAGAILEMRNE